MASNMASNMPPYTMRDPTAETASVLRERLAPPASLTGKTIAHAFDDLYYLERACQAQVIAMSTGRPMRRIPQDVARMTADQMLSSPERAQAVRHFEALKRLLDRQEPDYRD